MALVLVSHNGSRQCCPGCPRPLGHLHAPASTTITMTPLTSFVVSTHTTSCSLFVLQAHHSPLEHRLAM